MSATKHRHGKEAGIDVIIAGGGMAGLAAASDLSRAGFRVVLLEARGRLGGRVATRHPQGWPAPVELGAEFIHAGNAELWSLLKRAGLRPRRRALDHWLWRPEGLKRVKDLDRRISRVTRLIDPKKAGALSLAEYFRRHPPRVPPEDLALARGFVEGFEAAPLGRISARSLADETLDERHQYVLPGGYDRVVHALALESRRRGARLRLNSPIASIRWRPGGVEVAIRKGKTGRGAILQARAAVIALPLGVLEAGTVPFEPALAEKRRTLGRMEMGQVLRVSFLFRSGAWRRLLPAALRSDRPGGFGFIHSQSEALQAWWSLSDRPVLVGWAGGPAGAALLRLPARARRRRVLGSLARVLGADPAAVARALAGTQSHNWSRDPFARGAYSFTAAGGDDAAGKLAQPVRGTLFFAGEATAEGAEVGTVHGALRSGLRAAAQVRRVLK